MLSHRVLYASRTLLYTDESLHHAGADDVELPEAVEFEELEDELHLASCRSRPLAIMESWNDQITQP